MTTLCIAIIIGIIVGCAMAVRSTDSQYLA